MVLGQLDILRGKNLDPYLTAHVKINLKCITYLNVKTKTIKLLQGKIRENLHDYEVGK